MSAQLYRHFDVAGGLLYVGCSGNVIRRTEQHELQSQWLLEVATITVQHFASGAEALAAEASAIKAESPRYNLRGKVPDLRKVAKDREEWNDAALAEGRRLAAQLLSSNPKLYFDNTDLARAGLNISVALLQSGIVRKRKFGKRIAYARADIQALATASSDTWVISAPRIQKAA